MHESPLREREEAAVKEGVTAYERLLAKLADVPKPAEQTRRKINEKLVRISAVGFQPSLPSMLNPTDDPCFGWKVNSP
jgi:hypothetical protein